MKLPNTEEILLWLNARISYAREKLWATATLVAGHDWPVWVAAGQLAAPLGGNDCGSGRLVGANRFTSQWLGQGAGVFKPFFAIAEVQESLIMLVTVALSTFSWHVLVAA